MASKDGKEINTYERGNTLVFVLGDIGHSPRTLNSVKKLSETCSNVHVISYKQSNFSLVRNTSNSGSKLHSYTTSDLQSEIENEDVKSYIQSKKVKSSDEQECKSEYSNVIFHILHEKCWEWCCMQDSGFKSTKLWFFIGSIMKVLIQWIMIWYFLLIEVKVYHLNIIWCQSPPSIPTFIILFIVRYLVLPIGYLFRCNNGDYKWVIDWHNLGFTIMRVANRPIMMVKLAECIERLFGMYADVHFCVSLSFARYLKGWARINAITVYDKPSDTFRDRDKVSMEERHSLFKRLGWKINNKETIFTLEKEDGSIEYRQARPALILSSTSWTPDEDFGILLQSIREYDSLHEKDNYPHLHFVITGKGPMKSHYMDIISKLHLKKCKIETAWLEIEDYPLLLACADLGVCMHYSSSGIDLPMKVVDMFATGLPVCAIQFSALSELVQHKENGFMFQDSEELTRQLERLLKGFPNNCELLQDMRKNIQCNFQQTTWDDEWKKVERII